MMKVNLMERDMNIYESLVYINHTHIQSYKINQSHT